MSRLQAALVGALLLAGCVPPYLHPRPGEPAALVKVRLAYDHARALSLIPADGHSRVARVQILAKDANGTFDLGTRRLPDLLDSPVPVPLETFSALLRPDLEVALEVTFSVGWSTTTRELVTRDKQVSKEVSRTEPYFDSVTSSIQFRTISATEWVTEQELVWEPVTRDFSEGCTADVKFTPRRDAVYLVDYVNLAVAENCRATGFAQLPQADGSFRLRPLQAVRPETGAVGPGQ